MVYIAKNFLPQPYYKLKNNSMNGTFDNICFDTLIYRFVWKIIDLDMKKIYKKLWAMKDVNSPWIYDIFRISLMNYYNIGETAYSEIFNWRYEWVDWLISYWSYSYLQIQPK